MPEPMTALAGKEVFMNYKIVADSSANLFAVEGVDYGYVPLKIITAEKEFYDIPQQDVFEMLEYLKETKQTSSTSCPNAFEWKEAFGEADGVFAVTITSNLSGSCAAAYSYLLHLILFTHHIAQTICYAKHLCHMCHQLLNAHGFW